MHENHYNNKINEHTQKQKAMTNILKKKEICTTVEQLCATKRGVCIPAGIQRDRDREPESSFPARPTRSRPR